MLKINKCYTDFIVLMPIAQSKRKLIAATALFIARWITNGSNSYRRSRQQYLMHSQVETKAEPKAEPKMDNR